MATLLELHGIARGGTLIPKIAAAIAIQADAVRQEAGATANHANRLIWAKQAFAEPEAMAKRMQWAVLAANSSFTQAQILGATDSAIQTAVAAAVDVVAGL